MKISDGLKRSLDAAFKPESIAIIGASNNSKLGGTDMRLLIESGYQGKIYPVNIKEDIVQGHQAYRSVLDIPDQVDRAVIILPKKLVSTALRECAQKGVRAVQMYTAGYGEMGGQGKELEQGLVSLLQEAGGMRLVGPNCIGTYCPSSKITFTRGVSLAPGNIAFVSQSGGITFDMVTRGDNMGIRYSKAISVGNCIDLDHPDYLEYLADDEDTKAIGFYIESVKNMQRFTELLKAVTPNKPVVILKGGRTVYGSQSVSWHTGNVAGDYQNWQSLIEQTGAISVKTIDEMLSALISIQWLKPFKGGQVAVVGNGGGASVLTSDYCGEFGLEMAQLNGQTAQRLIESGVSGDGWNLNPVDMPANVLAADEGKLFGTIIRALNEDQSVNNILFHINLIPVLNYLDLNMVLDNLVQQLNIVDRSKTNLAVVLRYNGSPAIENTRYEVARVLLEQGIPVFNLLEEAVFGMSIVANRLKL